MLNVAIFTRVSSKAQDYQRQIHDLTTHADKQGYQVVEIISEKISASKKRNDERQGVARLLELARSKQITKVLATEVSRVGRKPSEVLKLIEELTELKISLYIANYGLETLLPSGKSNPAASLIIMLLADVARMETETQSERIISGQQEAKRKGKKLGRKEGSTKSNEKILLEYSKVVRDLQAGISVRKVSRIHDISTSTTQRIKIAMGSAVQASQE
jgi:DNA invertase Pin-like site-specific DNA recombinase